MSGEELDIDLWGDFLSESERREIKAMSETVLRVVDKIPAAPDYTPEIAEDLGIDSSEWPDFLT